MPSFIWIDQHKPEECEVEYQEWEEIKKTGVPTIFKGAVEYCTCPYGVHGGYTPLEASSAEEVLNLLPAVTKKNARVLQIDLLPLD